MDGKKREPKDSPPDALLPQRAIDLAEDAGRRLAEPLVDKALSAAGAIGRVQKALDRGVPVDTAIAEAVPVARGVVAEELTAMRFNRDAGLVLEDAVAVRSPTSNDPVRDLVILDGTRDVGGAQLKFGSPGYVRGQALLGKYEGGVITSVESAEALRGKVPDGMVTDKLSHGRVTTAPLTDSEIAAITRQRLENRLRRDGLSSWPRFKARAAELAPAALGAAAVTAVWELLEAARKGERPKADRVFRQSLKSAERAVLVHEVGRSLLLVAGSWASGGAPSQLGIKATSAWATPAAALAGFIVDTAMEVVAYLKGDLTLADLMRRIAQHAGAATLGAIGTLLGFYLGSHFHPAVAVILAVVLGLLGGHYGAKAGAWVYDRLAEPAAARLPRPQEA